MIIIKNQDSIHTYAVYFFVFLSAYAGYCKGAQFYKLGEVITDRNI